MVQNSPGTPGYPPLFQSIRFQLALKSFQAIWKAMDIFSGAGGERQEDAVLKGVAQMQCDARSSPMLADQK
jgi:hypothetical protein